MPENDDYALRQELCAEMDGRGSQTNELETFPSCEADQRGAVCDTDLLRYISQIGLNTTSPQSLNPQADWSAFQRALEHQTFDGIGASKDLFAKAIASTTLTAGRVG